MISVIGGETPSPQQIALAEEVGRRLALSGAVLVCGGGGGVMEAACRGARDAGGHTIGILPGCDAAETPPNAYVEFPVFTGIGYGRNLAVVLSGDAVIAVGGAYGTLSEIAYALIYSVPVVGLETWGFSYPGFDPAKIARASSPEQAVAEALALARRRRAPAR